MANWHLLTVCNQHFGTSDIAEILAQEPPEVLAFFLNDLIEALQHHFSDPETIRHCKEVCPLLRPEAQAMLFMMLPAGSTDPQGIQREQMAAEI